MTAALPPVKGVPFGERMRRERELRGVKLEEIAESTKIGKRNLEALEAEAFDQLPGGIFNKGFVRAYAKFLGLDEEQAVNDFLAASASTDQPTMQLQSALLKPAVMPSDEAVRKKDLRWAVAALIALVIFGTWFFLGRSSARKARAESAEAEPTSTTETKPKPAGSAPSAISNTGETPVPHSNPESATPSENKSASLSANTAPASAAKAANSAAPSSSQQNANAVTGPLVLSIHATADSWVSVTGDGAPLGDFQMHSGESRGFQADKELVLKAGNAGALELSLNGKRQPALGKDKEVKTVTFTAAGNR